MRRIARLSLLGVAAAIILSGCPLGIFNPSLGGTADEPGTAETEAGLITEVNADEAVTITGFTYASLDGTLTAATGQVLGILFNNGFVDADTVDAGIQIYPLVDAADNQTAYARGTALAKTDVTVVPEGGSGSRVLLTLDLSGTAISDQLEIFIDPTVLTAGNGAALLNTDGDSIPGEDNEDDVIVYKGVGSAPVTLGTGTPRLPQAQLFGGTGIFAGLGNVNAGTEIVFTGITDTEGTNNLTAASVTAGTQYFVWSDNAWTATSLTPAYDATTDELTFTGTFTDGQVYKVVEDLYQQAESAATAGYTHRGVYNQSTTANRYVTSIFTVGDVISGEHDVETIDLDRDPAEDTGLAADTTYSFRIGDPQVNYEITTGTTTPISYADLVSLLNTATSGDYVWTLVEDASATSQDLEVTTVARADFTTSPDTVPDIDQVATGTTADTTTIEGLLNSLGGATTAVTPKYALQITGSSTSGAAQHYIDVEFFGGQNVKLSSITQDSLIIYRHANLWETSDVVSMHPWQQVVKLDATTVRVIMPSTYEHDDSVVHSIVVTPTVVDDGADTASADDDVPYGSSIGVLIRYSEESTTGSSLEDTTWNW